MHVSSKDVTAGGIDRYCKYMHTKEIDEEIITSMNESSVVAIIAMCHERC